MAKFIPIYKPYKAKNQKKYLLDCIDSELFTYKSPYVERFEREVAKLVGARECVSVFNGSVSLMLILKALGIGPGDQVITQNLTYAATVSSILNVGARPVIIDSTSDFQMDISLVEKAITKKTKAVMIAGLYGDCADLTKLSSLCKKKGIYLIEDAAEVFGSKVGTKGVGTFGIASSFSFFANKICTTGEGGAVVTDDPTLARELRLLRGQSHLGGFKHAREGYNFRMVSFQAALGCAQLECFDEIVRKKRRIAAYYRTHLPKEVGHYKPIITSSEWMPLYILPSNISYEKFSDSMLREGVETRPCFMPISLMPGFKAKHGSSLKISEKIYSRGFNLPCYPDLTAKDLDFVIRACIKSLSV